MLVTIISEIALQVGVAQSEPVPILPLEQITVRGAAAQFGEYSFGLEDASTVFCDPWVGLH